MKKISYSFLAFTLSCLGIPLYIHIASFYFNNYQISLTLIGMVIFICRIFDCLFDIFSGFVSDYLISKKIKRTSIILAFAIPLSINFYFLFNPFYQNQEHLIYWLGANLLLLYFSLSFIVINYEAIIADIEEKKSDFIAAREFMQISGILLISVLPTIISEKYHISYDQSLSYLWIFILPFFAIAILLLHKNFRNIQFQNVSSYKISPNLAKFKKLFLIFFLNSTAIAIPAVSIRFYVDEHLKAANLNGYFLGLYFLSAAISVFIWNKIIDKNEVKKAWQKSILLSVIIFIFAAFIDKNNYYLFFAICLFSGFTVGCDLIAPNLILVDKIKNEQNKTSYFAVFSIITKISLALATFLVLNLIARNHEINYATIPYVYALLPCLFKILTVFFLKKL